MAETMKSVLVVAGAVSDRDGVGVAMQLWDSDGHCLRQWRRRMLVDSSEHGALIGILEGMESAREIGAPQVVVYCPSCDLVDRLNKRVPTAWNEPIARAWVRARALSHTFVCCSFAPLESGQSREIMRLAATVGKPVQLPKAA